MSLGRDKIRYRYRKPKVDEGNGSVEPASDNADPASRPSWSQEVYDPHIRNLGETKISAFSGRDRHKECSNGEQPTLVRRDKRTARVPVRVHEMRFRSLHHHSTYSFLDGYALPGSHVRRATEIGMDSFALTEHGNLASHVKFEQAANKEGIKPIFGCEFYCGPIDEGNRAQTKNHLTVLAATQSGYRNIISLVTEANSRGFHYHPTVSGGMLAANSDGLIVLSGCQGSLLFTSLMGGKGIARESASFRRAKSVAQRFQRHFGDRYFIEVQAFPELRDTCVANEALAEIARQTGIPLVATLDCHYTIPTEKEMQQILHNVRPGKQLSLDEQIRNWGYDANLCPEINDRTLLRKLIATGVPRQQAINAILATEEIAQDCNVELPKLPMVRYVGDDGRTPHELSWDWLREGWRLRGLHRLSYPERQRYAERIKYEMSIIEEKDFVDYFLIVADAMRFAKSKGIAADPRGSAVASVVCWLLQITELDPFKYDHLIFERFIDLNRVDLPDIDVDFESDRRVEVEQYLAQRYGGECVSKIATFTMYKAKNSLDDVAHAFKIPKYELDPLKEVLIERSSGDLRASATIEDTIEQFDQARHVVEKFPNVVKATLLEGNARQMGVHAAGIVVANGPLSDIVPVVTRKVRGADTQVVQVDKYDCSYLGLLKLDFLGLTKLDQLADCCRAIGEPTSFLYSIPLDDPEVVRGFHANDVTGIFQFDGRAVRSLNGSLKPDNIQEVCDITALARPGPLHNGAAQMYIDIKRGALPPRLVHPAIGRILAKTYYQIVYQEQILRIVREVGDFDWTDSAQIRKIISQKHGDQAFNRFKEQFVKGSQSIPDRLQLPAMAREEAEQIWGECITAGSYAFNAAHSASYGTRAWWDMWFKRHHPEAWFPSALRRVSAGSGGGSSANPKATAVSKAKLDPVVVMLRDARKHGRSFEVVPPNPAESEVTWTGDGQRLVAGLTQLPNIGESKARAIIEAREQGGIETWADLIHVHGFGHKTVEKIRDWAEKEDPFGTYVLDRRLSETKGDLPALGLPTPTHNALEIPYERGKDTAVTWIGIILHRNLRDIFEVNRARGEELDPEQIKNPELNEWVLMAGYDGEEIVSIRVNRYIYPRFKRMVWALKPNDDIVLVRGVKPGFRSAREIQVSKMWVLRD
jgi:DNA polymerase III subunit alpha